MGRSIGPGPDIYILKSTVGFEGHDSTKPRNPMYSFGIKSGFNSRAVSPGPIYDVDKISAKGPESIPAFSFGVKPRSRKKEPTPGPADYFPEKCLLSRSRRAPEFSFGDRTKLPSRIFGPGPTAYTLKSTISPKAYSIGKKYAQKPKDTSPGPACHVVENLDVYKKGTPKFTIGRRIERQNKNITTPGPADVGPDLYMPGTASYKYTFGIQHSESVNPLFVEADYENI